MLLHERDNAELLNGEVPVVKKRNRVDISNKLQEIQLGFPCGNTVDSHLGPPLRRSAGQCKKVSFSNKRTYN